MRAACALHARCMRAACALHARCMRAACALHARCTRAARALHARFTRASRALHARPFVQRASNTLCMRCQLASFFQILEKKVRRTTTHRPYFPIFINFLRADRATHRPRMGKQPCRQFCIIYLIIRRCARTGAFPGAFCVPNSVALASPTLWGVQWAIH